MSNENTNSMTLAEIRAAFAENVKTTLATFFGSLSMGPGYIGQIMNKIFWTLLSFVAFSTVFFAAGHFIGEWSALLANFSFSDIMDLIPFIGGEDAASSVPAAPVVPAPIPGAEIPAPIEGEVIGSYFKDAGPVKQF